MVNPWAVYKSSNFWETRLKKTTHLLVNIVVSSILCLHSLEFSQSLNLKEVLIQEGDRLDSVN